MRTLSDGAWSAMRSGAPAQHLVGGFHLVNWLLKESSSFRNERDAVSAGIRTGPNPQIFSSFFPDKAPFIETPRIWGF